MIDEIAPMALDTHFARLMVRLNGCPNAELEHAACVVSAWRAEGHICVPLSAIGGPGLAATLRESRVVGKPGEFKPLILDDADRLYLQRYWAYEAELAAAIRQRLGRINHDDCRATAEEAASGTSGGRRTGEPSVAQDPESGRRSARPTIASTLCVPLSTGENSGLAAETDEDRLAAGLARLFPGVDETDGQRMAAATAVRRKFCVITGGPGTGKTYTVARILALLADQFASRAQTPRLALTAPTGKAAARLQESLAGALDAMPGADELRRILPVEASTIHRLLGVVPGSPYFRHDAARPLAVDAVIVDESSMVDLALMAKLFAAIPGHARVILLGDKDQLASVEAGNVLGDICHPLGAGAPPPIAEHIVELRKAHRFHADSGIQRLSALVNAGDADAAIALLRAGRHADIRRAPTPAPDSLESALSRKIIEGFQAFLDCGDAAAALARLGTFRILCAPRRGPYGVENLNRLAERVLAGEGLIEPDATHYHGRPILILTNDYQLRLFNGDVGLILRDPEAGNDLRAFFADTGGTLRRVLPARLPAHETSFAMTVHKSQGSEFERVLFLLPDQDSPLATRELLYTGLTRARAAVELWADESVLRAAIGRRTERSSGLRDALWKA